MPIEKLEPIFQGVTPPGVRRALRDHVRGRVGDYRRVVVPCVGSFAMVEALVDEGVDPKVIETSDVSVYSTLVGFLLDPDKDPRDVGFTVHDDDLRTLFEALPRDGQVEFTAAALCIVKVVQIKGKSEFRRWQRLEFCNQMPTMYQKYLEGLKTHQKKLAGLSYVVRDGHEHIRTALAEADALIWYNPPAYKGGYTKMFEPDGAYSWNAPEIAEIDMKDIESFYGELNGAAAHVTLYAEHWYPLERLDWTEFSKDYAEVYGKSDRTIYLVTNRGRKVVARPKKVHDVPARRPPVYCEQEITEDSVLAMVTTTKELATYYYDLFIKALGVVNAETYFLFVVDGRVVGTVGFMYSSWARNRLSHVFEVFGITPTSVRYKKLNRLLMMYLLSGECRDILMANFPQHESLMLPMLKSMRTTCISKYAEVKINRGILKMKSREKMKGGRFKLVYEGKFNGKTGREVVTEWVTKHGQVKREE